MTYLWVITTCRRGEIGAREGPRAPSSRGRSTTRGRTRSLPLPAMILTCYSDQPQTAPILLDLLCSWLLSPVSWLLEDVVVKEESAVAAENLDIMRF